MSLKNFHILFISVSVVLAAGFGVWSVYTHTQEPGRSWLVMGVLSLMVGAALVVYGVWFLQKIKRLNES
jgi:uncharacterized membrane protein